jgi:hypothetical protein
MVTWREIGFLTVGLACLLAACGRPTGDFGRAEPSYLHDTILPALGKAVAVQGRGTTVSGFPMTADEIELRDRSWNFVRAPHVRDWWLDTLVEGERTRILPILRGEGQLSPDLAQGFPRWSLPLLNPAFDASRYHRYLLSDAFISTEARWQKLISDIGADTALVPPFCDVAARVRRADVGRISAVNRQRETTTALGAEAMARVSDNQDVMSWVWQAIGYRLTSYRFAIDHMEIETPSVALASARLAYNGLATSKCQNAPALKTVPSLPERHSRLLDAPDPFYTMPVPQK